MKLSEAVKSHIEICRPLRQTDSPNAPRTVASSPRRLVDLALVTQNRGFDPMDLEITVFILYNKKEKAKRIHIVRWEACLRKTERAAIRRYGQSATRQSHCAAVTGCDAPPCSSVSAQSALRPAAARGLAPTPGGVCPRVARPSARAPHGRRGYRAAGAPHSFSKGGSGERHRKFVG